MNLTKMLTRRSLGKSLMGGSGAAVLVALLLSTVQTADAQYRYIPEHRRPIDATIHDLEAISAHTPHGPRDQRRYEMATRQLSEFAGRLQQGFWDDRKLNESIGAVRAVADNNPMDGRARNLLQRDIGELISLRDHHDARYHYPY